MDFNNRRNPFGSRTIVRSIRPRDSVVITFLDHSAITDQRAQQGNMTSTKHYVPLQLQHQVSLPIINYCSNDLLLRFIRDLYDVATCNIQIILELTEYIENVNKKFKIHKLLILNNLFKFWRTFCFFIVLCIPVCKYYF